MAVPSNSAGDLICARLHEYVEKKWLDEEHMIRFLACQRDINLVPEVVRGYVVREDNEADNSGDFLVEKLRKARIVVATWHMCGNLHTKQLQ